AQENDNSIDIDKHGEWIALPYAFVSDSTGLVGGVGTIAQGLLQEDTTFIASLMYGAEEDVITNGVNTQENFSGAFLAFSNLKIPYTERLFFSFWGLNKSTPKGRYYKDGSMTSREEDVLISSGEDNYLFTKFRYVLPIGDGLDNPNGRFHLKNGFAMGREGKGNGTPFSTGETTIGLESFYISHEYDNWETLDNWDSSGFRIFIEHDNTDFKLNPSRGYNFSFKYSNDTGGGDSLQNWDFLEFKYNKYFELDNFSFSKQDVLAISTWTGYSFSWDNDNHLIPYISLDRPPLDEGGRLGGMFRMRGYDSNRFSGKAVLYGTAEYRSILKYNPFQSEKFLKDNTPVAIDWFQVVGFVEAGAVSDDYDSNLVSDMKFDVGLSLRAMAAELPIRFDVAYGDEGVNMWVMIQHPFDF
ncbi:MAG: BamA/TamA family outer membrane protein, partial [Sulfurovum sp.]|nr:BamA/TamA family outer membrane protein [Sulfurovaceae bacterium]